MESQNYKSNVFFVVSHDGAVRIRADSMRQTVLVDIDDGKRAPQHFVISRDSNIIHSLGVCLSYIAPILDKWEKDE